MRWLLAAAAVAFALLVLFDSDKAPRAPRQSPIAELVKARAAFDRIVAEGLARLDREGSDLEVAAHRWEAWTVLRVEFAVLELSVRRRTASGAEEVAAAGPRETTAYELIYRFGPQRDAWELFEGTVTDGATGEVRNVDSSDPVALFFGRVDYQPPRYSKLGIALD